MFVQNNINEMDFLVHQKQNQVVLQQYFKMVCQCLEGNLLI
jgi:hypothetical protein